NKVHFKKYGEMNSLEGKSNKTGIRFTNNKLIWNGLAVPVVIKRNDIYAQTALENNKVKYCRIVRKLVRGKYKFYVQLVMEGMPPTKYNKETGEVRNPVNEGRVGLDIGTQTIAIASNKEVKLLELAPSTNNMEREKRILQHKLDRQRRANNPNKYNEDGTIKEGNRDKWIFSNRYIKARNALAEIQRKIASKRKQDHEKLANYILSLGNDIKVETMSFQGLQARAKETTINEKTGNYNKKKRFGKSIANKAPSMLLTILDNKLKFQDTKLKKVDTYSVKASQYNHVTNEYNKKELGQRWNDFGDFKIQRDLYSAFLIMNVNEDLKTINRELCFRKFGNFKELHDLEINRIKSSDNELISSMGI
ncbi:transposase, partial [Caldibacillus thermoamylovorans]|nr:transposase [Caldibacillus thermoamylovorans]